MAGDISPVAMFFFICWRAFCYHLSDWGLGQKLANVDVEKILKKPTLNVSWKSTQKYSNIFVLKSNIMMIFACLWTFSSLLQGQGAKQTLLLCWAIRAILSNVEQCQVMFSNFEHCWAVLSNFEQCRAISINLALAGRTQVDRQEKKQENSKII